MIHLLVLCINTPWYSDSDAFRYEAVLLRQRFEEKRNVKDMRIAKQLLEKGEQELFEKQHYQPKKCEYNSMVYNGFVLMLLTGKHSVPHHEVFQVICKENFINEYLEHLQKLLTATSLCL